MLRVTRPFGRSLPRTLTTAKSSPTLPDGVDAVVVGAGPAGAATAYHLTRLGLSNVLLLDTRPLPF